MMDEHSIKRHESSIFYNTIGTGIVSFLALCLEN